MNAIKLGITLFFLLLVLWMFRKVLSQSQSIRDREAVQKRGVNFRLESMKRRHKRIVVQKEKKKKS